MNDLMIECKVCNEAVDLSKGKWIGNGGEWTAKEWAEETATRMIAEGKEVRIMTRKVPASNYGYTTDPKEKVDVYEAQFFYAGYPHTDFRNGDWIVFHALCEVVE